MAMLEVNMESSLVTAIEVMIRQAVTLMCTVQTSEVFRGVFRGFAVD